MATQTGSIDLRGVKQSYESVDVGGTNLLRGTATQDTTVGNWREGATETDETLFGCIVFRTPGAWNDIGFEFDKQLVDTNKVKAGDTITYSIWAKTDDTTSRDIYGIWVSKYDGSGNYYSGSKIATLTNAWTQYSKTIVVTAAMIDGSTTRARLTRFECNTTCTSGKYIYWAAPKVEFGNKATAWSPAPEDVQDGIDTAQNTATSAQNTANTAQVAANDAQANANYAIDSANVATEFANAAQNTANEAMDNVSNIEQIVGASTWVTSHGIYDKSTDTEVDTTKEYFTVSATAISDPKGNPHNGLYYEFSNNTYVLTSDNIVVTGKTYYTLSANLVNSPSGNPSTNGYYERSLHESVEEYLSTHILMKSDGLFVTDGSDSQVQINPTGVSILNGEKTIASYGSVAQIGAADKFHIMIGGEENEIGFYQGENVKLAYLNGNELYVQNSLSFGNYPHNTFTFYQRANGHFTLKLVD